MRVERLREIARAMIVPDKGAIAIDEATGTIAERFAGVGMAHRGSRNTLRLLEVGTDTAR